MFWIHYVILAMSLILSIATSDNFVRNEDICGIYNGRRLYLELGEHSVLYAKNVTFVPNATRQQVSRVYVANSSHAQCSLEFVTCPSCVIVVTFKSLSLPHHCGDNNVLTDNPCRCDYVWMSEPPYEGVSGRAFCGMYASAVTYRSSTRSLAIALLYSQSHKHAFTLEYVAQKNRLHLNGANIMTGVAKTMNRTTGGILMSPFFPARYPRDLGMEYTITCPSEAPSCRIRVLFSDFQLATVSIIEFYDWNGQRLDVSSGARFRPPVIVSSGPTLFIRFYANGGTGLGYKAFYSFVIGHAYDKSFQPITDCTGYVETIGGAITMMDMVGQGVKMYDCVWLIRPSKSFLRMKTHMYLKVITFADMAGNTELIIKPGPTSALLPLEVLRHPANKLQPPRFSEHIAPVTSGFHVSLRGSFGPTSRLVIAYTAFNYVDCLTGSDFLCENRRCIPSQLNCDSFDHCGDNSDEPATCFRDWNIDSQDRKWHINKTNYYFPKIDHYPDLKTATFVFIASSLGLIVLISALIVLLYRVGARARQQRELQSRLQTISELLDNARIDDVPASDDPPVYEAPPGYDEVIKVGLESEEGKQRKRQNARRELHGRSSSGQCSNDLETQSTALLMTEGPSTSRSSQTTPVSSSTDQSVPESPPPPYITPPGTVPRNLNSIVLISPCRTSRAEQASRCENRASCVWLQDNDDGSCSVPLGSAPSSGWPSTSTDAEAFDAYLQTCTSNIEASQTPILQSADSQDISKNMNLTSEGKLESIEDSDVSEKPNCMCEGACGCATVNYHETVENQTLIEPLAFEGKSKNDTLCPRDTVIKLLGTSKNIVKSLQNININSLTISRASTPCGTLGSSISRNSSRKTSICSRDSNVTKTSIISPSHDKLHDEFEIVSETTSVLGITNSSNFTNTPNDTSKISAKISSCARNYSVCDAKSLYESTKILDLFLARRGMSVVRNRNQSVAIMLFGTPKHGGRRVSNISVDTSRRINRTRIWRSSDDSFTN